jgi:hypothetical protein
MFRTLITIAIALNLAVSSVPRCGLLRQAASWLIGDQAAHLLRPATCHDEQNHHHQDSTHTSTEQNALSSAPAISNILFCPCKLSQFSYIWIVIDLVPSLMIIHDVIQIDIVGSLIKAFEVHILLTTPPPRTIPHS